MSVKKSTVVDDVMSFLFLDPTLACYSGCQEVDSMFVEQKQIEFLRAIIDATQKSEMPVEGDVISHLNFLRDIISHRAIKSFIVKYLKDFKEIIEHRDKQSVLDCLSQRCGMDDDRVNAVYSLAVSVARLVNDAEVQKALGELTKTTLAINESMIKKAVDVEKVEKVQDQVLEVEEGEIEEDSEQVEKNEEEKPKEVREKKSKKNRKKEEKDRKD